MLGSTLRCFALLIQVPITLQQKVFMCSHVLTSVSGSSQKRSLVSPNIKGFDVFCSYAIVLVVTNPGKEKSVCPLLLRLHVRAHFNKRVKEQQPKSRGWLWVSGPLCKLIASGGLLGEEKGMMPHLSASRRDTMLMAAEITWFSYFFSEGFVSKCTNRVGSLTYCNLQHN